MIIGGSKKDVIKNIENNIKDKELNKKAELTDPVLSDEERNKILKKFFNLRKRKLSFYIKNKIAYQAVNKVAKELDPFIEIKGLENIKKVEDGAIVTSNHFNPLDNLIVRKMILNRYHKNIYIVSQETNLAMPGKLGFLFNHLNIIPICKSPSYINDTFKPVLSKVLNKKNYVLIYPEEEMWFNYCKPRPCKRGAYQFAAECNKPIISCFTEMVELNEKDNDEFNQLKYIIHVLKPIYPDPHKSARENSIEMAEKDYKQKVAIYEKVYKQKLDYKFSLKDIKGYRGK